jgi:hypothetical protein
MIDQNIEIGKIVINSEKSHLGAGQPIYMNSRSIPAPEGGNEGLCPAAGRQQRLHARERCAQQGRTFATMVKSEPDRIQLERNLARRGSFRLLPGVVVVGVA